MKSKILLPLLTAAVLLSASCREEKIRIDSLEKEIFLRMETTGVYRLGRPAFVYDADRHQEASNRKRRNYRIQTNEQDTCLNVQIQKIPKNTGVHIATDVDYIDPEHIVAEQTLMECSRLSGDRIWLWDKERLTGVILRYK